MKADIRGLAVFLVLTASVAVAREPSRVAPESAPSSGDVAPAGEPGDRLEVKGDPVPIASGIPNRSRA